ncbi:hypothetical protein KDA_67060 [Dictyobacter alpinus]|uniref:histidine kinase n=2 Tax=Dictyobacter alpinus TaxID=2014873 RepID=A0A402BJ11_9CHLR|nr:hypothetical protein KDA_67060 [Dictyobacter alpinus]
MEAALHIIGHFLECQTLFIARFEVSGPEEEPTVSDDGSNQRMLKIIAAHNTAMPAPTVGSKGMLEETYCHTIFQTGQPLLVEDARNHPFYQHLATTEKYDIGFYLGVPLIYSDGRLYGTLCSQDPSPHLLTNHPEKVELMQIVARFLISYIEREELIVQVRAAEEAQAALAWKEQQTRVEADRRVRELQAIFETIGDGLLVSNQDGQFQMNAAARRLIPMRHENIQSIMDLQSEDAFILNESGQPLPIDQWPITRVLRGEHLIGANIATIQRVNGLGERRYLSVSGMPMYDQQKRISGGVCIFRDETERYVLEWRTQETLHALLTFAQSLVWLPENTSKFRSGEREQEISSVSLACQTLTQVISTLLQCQDVGIISRESETARWHLQTNCGTDQPAKSPWWQTIKQHIDEFTAQDANRDGLRDNEISILPLPAQPGADAPILVEVPMFVKNHLLGKLALIYHQHDATLTPTEATLVRTVARLTGLVYEREHLLQEQAETRAHTLALQETNQRFNEFLSIASHELKGPLTALKMSVQLARRVLRQQETVLSPNVLKKLHRYLEGIDGQIHMQDRLTTDLLDVSRIRAGKLELQKQRCDVAAVVRACVENQRQTAEGRTIQMDLPTERMIVCGDADRLGQVVNNYLSNALKYSPFDEQVKVLVEPEGAEIRVTISDRGPGLTFEEQERIWERFYRAKGVLVLSGNGIGLGLGLHICKTIIEQHGGRVGVISTPGQGSHFWFTLPLFQDICTNA